MRIPRAILSLPPSLLLLLATQLHAQAVARNERDGLPELPTAVRKMSLDEGEKFMPEYFAFAPAGFAGASPQPLQVLARQPDSPTLTPEEDALLAANSSAALQFHPPFLIHYEDGALIQTDSQGKRDSWSAFRRGREAIARLQGRGFTCPGGTHGCADINQPNYCCTDGTVCFVVENAPDAGNVGCCPDGQTCGGSVAACSDGNTACPADDGGGCCIPGFVCADIGCVPSTATFSAQATTTTPTTSPKPTTSTPTATQTNVSSYSTGTGLAPVRPTSSGPSPSTTGTTDYCPTGFYACLASAGSGCCRTGRDCSTTSCPPVASTTIITHGATVVVPLTDAQAAAKTTATCAGGWFLCGTDAGPVAGCCPSGYKCGAASCTLAAASATETLPKELAGGAASPGWMGLKEQQKVVLAWMTIGWALFHYGAV
ncbi:hypothetical protein GGS21DRAFT_217907 [Xylaria nigripes]|nr:hypothetical protein GGS21DRAFT_217907 [Xylaria nigripes]